MKMDRDFTLKQTSINQYVISMASFILGTDPGFQVRGAQSISTKKKKKKKILQIGIHIILVNYNYKKLFFIFQIVINLVNFGIQ